MNRQNHLHFDCLDSTNAYLKRLLSASADPLEADFYVITADKQENGRGRQNKAWESEAGKNLLMSILLHPQYTPQDQFYICRYVSLALVELLTTQLQMDKVSIKWPNDIYVNDKKIAGILIEHFLQGNRINYSIAGIGLNVNQTVFSENIPNPTSILLETNKALAPLFCMEAITENIEKTATYSPALLEEKYEQYLYKKNQYAYFLLPKQSDCPLKAKIKGVTKQGLLHLSDEQGRGYDCAFNEVVYLVNGEW